jgi:LuxR family transcriptional regulator, maltose regulon positive regulatory protein
VATSVAAQIGGAAPDLLLKVTPPRVPRDLVVRPRLHADDAQFQGRAAIIVQAPAGFGKTLLLAQWRREHLAHGRIVAWFSAEAEDNPQRFVRSLALAVRIASGRPTFGHTLLAAGAAPGGFEGITSWLAEVAQSALDIVLTVDGAEQLPPASRATLAYLLHNAPANLRVEVAARGDHGLAVADLVTYGQCVVVGAALLRFRLEETLGLARARFGTRIDADTAAQLHELTEGWPLGLQLALAAIGQRSDLRTAFKATSVPAGDLHDYFVDMLVKTLAADDAAFLARIAIVDNLHPELCRALTDAPEAPERLARLARETPIFVAGENSDWLRMHSLARDVLRARSNLTVAEQADLHTRASRWFEQQEMLEDAARHALAAGQREAAFDLAERCLYDALMRRGQQITVLEWVGRLPRAELDKRPRLLLAAAWALALSARHQEAERLVARILKHAGADTAMRCECALILSGAAAFADDPDRFAQLHDPWAESPPLSDPVLLYVHANRKAFRAILEGDPAQARLHQQQAPRVDVTAEFTDAIGYVSRWGEFITALSYLWEGQVLLAESLLGPALASADAHLSRRNPFACMLAALLAAVVWERDRPLDAAALLANRVDVLERSGLPEAVLLGYRTASRIAVAEEAEHRALELLEGMHAVGVARKWPRLCIASLGDQIRVHARRFRAETCRALCERIDALLASDDVPQGELWRRNAQLLQLLARANTFIAAQEWRRALDPLTKAGVLADSMKLGRVRIEVMALRAFALDRSGEKSVALLREAIDLANAYGLARLFVDAHPELGDWSQRVSAEQSAAGEQAGASSPLLSPATRKSAPRDTGLRANPTMALTPKEREVLQLLARNLSNKEIALAMQIGEETIKWHLKNLFGKLAAGSRKQVVRRATLLGLLESA